MLALLLLIAIIFIIPAQLELPDVDFEHCSNAKNFEACLKDTVEKQRGGTYDMDEVIIWSGIGTRGGTNKEGGGGSDELLISVRHMIHAIPMGTEQYGQANEYNLVSIFSYENNPGEFNKIGMGHLDASNNLHVNSEPNDEDENWDSANDDEHQKFGACTKSSDYSVQMCSWAKVSENDVDHQQQRRVVKICTSIYRVLAKGKGRQRVLPLLGCVTLDDICLMKDPDCSLPSDDAATFSPKNAKMQEAGKTEF